MTLELDDLIDAIVTIGNSKRVNEHCEPNLMQHLKLENWMVVRSLVAWELFCDEREHNRQGGYGESFIRKDT